jgi:hypothetical protein
LLGDYLYIKDQYTGRIYALSLSTKTVTGYIQIGQFRSNTNLPEGINPVIAGGRLIFSQGDRIYGYSD